MTVLTVVIVIILTVVIKTSFSKESSIRETKNLLTDADSSTNICFFPLPPPKGLLGKKKEEKRKTKGRKKETGNKRVDQLERGLGLIM